MYGQKSRKQDNYEERHYQPFLDMLYRKNNFHIKRLNDKRNQIQGIDIMLNKNGEVYIIDEKNATSYKNAYEDLQTFSFEIYSNNNPNGIGWLLNSDNKNTHYNLIFMKQNENEKRIDAAEILMIEKEKILNMVQKYFKVKDNNKIIDKAMELLDKKGHYVKNNKREMLVFKTPQFSIVESLHLREQPINIIIQRDTLRAIATQKIHFIDEKELAKEEDLEM